MSDSEDVTNTNKKVKDIMQEANTKIAKINNLVGELEEIDGQVLADIERLKNEPDIDSDNS